VSSPSLTPPEHMPTPPARSSAASRINFERLAPLAYVVVLIGSAFAAYWAMFSEFAPYDDSGWFIHSIRLFSEGHALYNQVFTDYGPFSYELWAAVFGLAGHTLSTDSGRLAIVGLWLVTSLLLGVSTQRLTGRLTLGVIVQALSFNILIALNAEPMHASDVVCALFAVTVAVISFVLFRRRWVALFVLGALVAALAFTKVNIGGYAAIALAYGTVMTLPGLRRVRILRWLAAAALVAVGPVIMWSDLTQQWAQDYSILAVGGTLAIVLSTGTSGPSTAADRTIARQWLAWLSAGFATCTIVVLAIMLATGSSLAAWWQETVIVPSHQATSIFSIPASFTEETAYWAVGAVAAAWVVGRLRATSIETSRPSFVGALARIFTGIAIWFSIVAAEPLKISPENANFALAMILAWVAAIPSTRDDGSEQWRFVRLFLPSFAVLEALQAYPVAGSQAMFGSLLLLVCGAVCFADGWSDLETWGLARSTIDGARTPRTIMVALATALAVALGFQYVVRPLEFWGDAYATNPSLGIAGATRLHLPAGRVATYTQITALLRAHCRSVITLPGMFSFNLWSGLPAPSGMAAEQFWAVLSRGQERIALASAQAAPTLCAVRNNELAANWDGGKPPPLVPLVRFIEQDFTPIAEYEGYVVSVRRS
jgi:hypothetical protein